MHLIDLITGANIYEPTKAVNLALKSTEQYQKQLTKTVSGLNQDDRDRVTVRNGVRVSVRIR